LMVPIVIILNFIVLQIPLLDDHLSRKYENEFREYAKRTKKFVPFIY
jgi:steroid 5-alpha reductase family enzyme